MHVILKRALAREGSYDYAEVALTLTGSEQIPSTLVAPQADVRSFRAEARQDDMGAGAT
jgi:hypothetical protein